MEQMYHGDEILPDNLLYDWFEQGYDSLLSRCPTQFPSFGNFVMSQFDRFRVPMRDGLASELVNFSGTLVDQVLGLQEPYAFFWDTSDVALTDEWRNFSYQLKSGWCGEFEVNPEKLETYRLAPGQDEVFFNEAIMKPSIEALPFELSYTIEETIGIHDYNIEEWLNHQASDELAELCKVKENGVWVVDQNKQENYFKLASWAALLWALGPMGRDWRYSAHDIFRLCYDHGACILYDCNMYDPTSYIRLERAPRSCYICNVSAWCVEITLDGDVTRNICEHCLNSGLGLGGGSVCGTKFCHHVSCPNHPEHTTAYGGYWMSVRGRGQLQGLAGGPRINQGLGGGGQIHRLR